MASYCCFWKPRRPTNWPMVRTNNGQLISFQEMLGLLGRPNVGVVVIEGIGGSGKTWAAKAAYQAARTSNIFNEYIWVTLSISCSLRQCMNKIASSLSCKIGDNLSVERTKTMIKEYLTQRKFLLVLDNAYFTEEGILEYLGVTHLQQQSPGSKIFVTTRTVRTSSVMEADIVLTPELLTYEESYNLLRKKIGKDINFEHDLISYCYGIPLIILILAGVLCDAPTQEAFSELVANAHVALGTQISVFNTMKRLVKFGYHQLPSDNARHCLLYCLLFPEDQGISVKELIWHWRMDGLLQEAISFDEANHIGKEILYVLTKHGMVYLEDNDNVRMHDVIRETVSSFREDKVYKEQHGWCLGNPIFKLDHLAEHSNRVSLMYTDMECLRGSPRCFFLSSLLLRGNCLLKAISEEFFCHMGNLETLDLSFTRIEVLPRSISCLTRLRMLLLIGCDHLEEIRHIAPLVQLEVLDVSGCGSLKSIDSGSFDRMVLLKVLDLSATSITFLTSIPASTELRHLNLQGCPFLRSELPYGVSKSGAVGNLQLGSIEDLADWIHMLWLPCGLTFQLSDRFGMKVSLDVGGDSKTYVYASDAYLFKCLKENSPLWFNCFQKFQIVISPLMDDQTMDTDAQVMKTDSIFQNSYFRTKHFTHSIDPERYLEINGTVGVPSDLDGILCHAELISLKRLTMTTQFSDLNIKSMKAVRELWIENCEELESLLTPDEVQALSAVGSLHKLWISNIENLSSFCKGVKDVTSFSCMKHLLLDCCPNLACLFPSALRIPSLEMLHIRFCDNLERVLDTSVLGEDNLPRLQSLQLWELPELTSVCSGVLPLLKKLEKLGALATSSCN
ncbi:probable disease resistance protein At4g27220 isoform X2 [Phragmites australis]|uniref:probable disease resistance protein At4g27220 isoform X2 n=1 Tax=Phragmites australis TaxID=29695 RepID=UPI002D76B5A0|nr:probable disease resistance protein At4g27220 isoform X2 [Phragmites australis]